jgi:hypothetical protein
VKSFLKPELNLRDTKLVKLQVPLDAIALQKWGILDSSQWKHTSEICKKNPRVSNFAIFNVACMSKIWEKNAPLLQKQRQ